MGSKIAKLDNNLVNKVQGNIYLLSTNFLKKKVNELD